MTWFRVDDHASFHAKVVKAGNEAFGAFCRAGAHASGHGTDGFVEDNIALLIAPQPVWDRLVDVRLAHREDAGWRLHDYLDWNPSAKQVEKLRRARAAAGKNGGRVGSKRRASGQDHAEASAQAIACESGEAKGEDQDRSGSGSPPEGVQGGGAKPKRRASGCPPSSTPNEEVQAWFARWNVPRTPESEHWLDHHRSKGSTFLDWAASWRTWQKNGVRFGRAPAESGIDFTDRRGRVHQGHGGVDKYIPEGL